MEVATAYWTIGKDNRSDLLSFQMLMKCSNADICQNKSGEITTDWRHPLALLCRLQAENRVEVTLHDSKRNFYRRDAINNLRVEIR